MDKQHTNTENSNQNTLNSNMAKINQAQFSSIRPYQKLSRNQQIRNQSDLVQFESPPAFTDYSHKSNGISPFMSNNQNASNQQNEKKQVSLNLNNQILQDVSNKSSNKVTFLFQQQFEFKKDFLTFQNMQSPRYNSQTAPSSPIKPILVKKTQPKRSIVEFNVTMNKLEEKDIANENDLSGVHFSISSNQDLDQCASSRTNTTHKKSAQETVNESLYQLREEMRPPQTKPIIYPSLMEKDNSHIKITIPFETKDKPFQITCDSHRNTKGSPRNTRDQNDSQLEDIYLLERYSQDNRHINQLNFNNKFNSNQNAGQQNLVYHTKNERQEQDRKSSLSNISMTAKNNTSQLIQNYSSEELQYKLNYSSRYLPSSRTDINEKQTTQLDNQTKKKIEQNTPKFNRNTNCDSGQRGISNPHKIMSIAPQTQEFNHNNMNYQQEFYDYNSIPSAQQLKNRQTSPNNPSNNNTSAQKYLFGADENRQNSKILNNRNSNANEQLTIDDLDLMRQFQIEAYNNFINNPAVNSGSQKNVIDSARKRDFSPNTIITNNIENINLNSTINQNNNSYISNSRYQQQNPHQHEKSNPNYLPTNTDAQSIYSANMQKYCEGDNFNSNKGQQQQLQQKPQEYVNCSPIKANQSNLQFIHERLARQKEVIMNNANFHLENSGNIKNKSQRMSPLKDRLQINVGDNHTDISHISNNKSGNKFMESASILSPQKMNQSKLSPKDQLPEYLKFSNQKSNRSQTPISQLKKWKEQNSSIGGDNSLGGIKNLPNRSSAIQKIQSPQSSASKRDLLEKLLKKSPTSQIPQSHSVAEENNILIPSIPSENELIKHQRYKSNSDLIINETTPNTKMQQILYGRNKETLTPKSNSITPTNKTLNLTPKNASNQNQNKLDEIDNNNQSYRSPKNVENLIQTKQAAIALMLNDKITKRQPSPMNKNSVLPSPKNKNSVLPSPRNQQKNINGINKTNQNSVASSPKNIYSSVSQGSNRNNQISPRNSQISPRNNFQSPKISQVSPKNNQNHLINNQIPISAAQKSPKNQQFSPKQQLQVSPKNFQPYSPKNSQKKDFSSPKAIYSTPKHYQNLSETPRSGLNQDTQFNEIYRQLNDTKIQNKINMIKSQLQTINKQNNQILQQHENMQQTLQQPCTSANSFNSLLNQPNQYDQNKYQTPQQFYYPQSGIFNNSGNTVTTTTVTTIHTYNKNSPQKSASKPPLYSPKNSKYSDLELAPLPTYVQSNISNTPVNIDTQKFQPIAPQKIPFTLEPSQEQIFVNTPQSRKSQVDADYEQRKRQSNKINTLFQNQTANNSPARNHQDSATFDIKFPQHDNIIDDQNIHKPLSDYFVARKAHIAKRLEDNKEQSKERSKLKSLTPTHSKERSKANILEKRKQVQQQFSKQNSSNIMNISETHSYFFDTNNNMQQQQVQHKNSSSKNQSRSISPFTSKKNNSSSRSNLNINDASFVSQISQKNTGLSKTPSSNSLLDRLVKGEKVKMSEKEMREQSKRRYQNLPDVKKQKEEQIKNASKLEEYKKRHEKMRQLDEVWRQKNRSFLQN
ncbi:endo-1,4-beta-xylanase xylA, putative (macronuclear) [Tetrahymena thermophila SB210]|uniref:Endo-1,4-beta-xylanase xylA, putative n=1 Tax=Tetrahymena thermophila (strain SB210) TaxID=312017 RepID=Q22XL4_TETTS|nr:endo-1,4-beta-xylanase xylA, putative [Tetrahymena thermophila SB210]EAR89996.2 endo-1,4-beta-xylanase xylA, putative [Tetrahymena thermophila SB210]|eukprot:XP_001010241.2 endo-1,4-beta-xylanase xylA, putative [Tetrahymena thermophila SB210]